MVVVCSEKAFSIIAMLVGVNVLSGVVGILNSMIAEVRSRGTPELILSHISLGVLYDEPM